MTLSPSDATGRLVIDVQALRENYRTLKTITDAGVNVSAVVKANAYGLGAQKIASFLKEEGCTHFFVANLKEAQHLRAAHPDITIIILNGFYGVQAESYLQGGFIPVLDSMREIEAYQALAQSLGKDLPAYLHCNTGMNRLGMDWDDVQNLAQQTRWRQHIDLRCVMSHLACADEKDHPLNAQQLKAFQAVKALFPTVPAALANSSGIFLGAEYHGALVRPGMALYGLNPTPYAKTNPMRPVVSLNLPVVCTRMIKAGQVIGYGATYRFACETPVATIGAGYADGIFRSLSNKGALYWNGVRCPIIGRVSMDLLSVDLSALSPDQRPQVGDQMELIGPHQTPADLGALAGSFDYEILTALSPRYQRLYL